MCLSEALLHLLMQPWPPLISGSLPPNLRQALREKYTMRVPNEKQVNTIRVEGEFPAGLQI